MAGEFVKTLVCSTENSQSCLDPPTCQNGTMAEDELVRRENKLRKIQPSEQYDEMTFVFRRGCVRRIQLWPPGWQVLAGAGETPQPDWIEHV